MEQGYRFGMVLLDKDGSITSDMAGGCRYAVRGMRKKGRLGSGAGNVGEGHDQAMAVGRKTRVAQRYSIGTLSTTVQDDAPTIHEVATIAVEQKSAGRAVDAGVAAKVGMHLGHDFSSVRVHDDPLSGDATTAMSARAFAYGGGVFLGPGESDRDLGLMAHELTHVAQQGAAEKNVPLRQVKVGTSDSPAEREADAVAAQVTGGARPQVLLVDDAPVQPGQMLKSVFLDQLRGAVTAAADQELGPVFSAVGCPYIDQYFGRYAGRPAAAGEALLHRYAPGTRGVISAAAMIPLVVARVREGIRTWKETGAAPDVPEGMALPGGGPVAAAMGTAQAMDAGTASRMTEALGHDVSGAHLHLGPEAHAFAAKHDARAVTIGPHVAFASGAYQPGTIEGDALLAHELGHVVQQQGATMPIGREIPEADPALEDNADQSAAGAIARLWGGAKTAVRKASAIMRSGVTMARCPGMQLRPGGAALDLSRVPDGPARAAAIAMQGSAEAIDQNTVRRLADGTLTVAYIEDLAHPANEVELLAAKTPPRDPAVWMLVIHPRTGAKLLAQRDFAGFQAQGYLFGLRSQSEERWRTLLVHETNHAVNADNDAPIGSFERYRAEFRAYWVAEYAGVADLDERARQIRKEIVDGYPDIRAHYQSDAKFKARVDGHTRPDGNLDNRLPARDARPQVPHQDVREQHGNLENH